MRRIGTAVLVGMAAMTVSCSAIGRKAVNVDVIVFNYTPQPIAEVTVQGHYIGGYYEEYDDGGTGGKSYCCVEVQSGEAEVSWEFDREVGTLAPPEGWQRTIRGEIPVPEGVPRYLGVHVYPGPVVEFTLTESMPLERKQGSLDE